MMLLSAMIVIMTCRGARAASQTLWQIGTFDHSSSEFNQKREEQALAGGRLAETSRVYIVGKSDPKTDWYAFQPGSRNERAGSRPHPYTIQFDLAAPPKGGYFLKVGFVIGRREYFPTLQVDINGQQGWVYHHPQWHDVPGDKYWADEVEVQLPTPSLKPGANTLILTAIDEPGSDDRPRFTGLEYDALELDLDPSQAYDPSKVSVEFEPTIYYQQKGEQLEELVDVYLRHNSPARDGRFDLTLGSRQFSAKLVSQRGFGEEHFQLSLPEFAAGAKADASVTLGKRSQRLPVALTPAKKWTLLIVPHEHIDVGYTDYQAKVSEIQSRVLDEAMDMIGEHPDFRYSVDGYWVIQEFLAGRNAQDRQRLLQLVREHKIFVPAEYANLLTEFPAVETLIRSLYPSYRFDRENGANFDYAISPMFLPNPGPTPACWRQRA